MDGLSVSFSTGSRRESRCTIHDRGRQVDLSGVKTLIRIKTQRKVLHSGGSLNFDAAGHLYASSGTAITFAFDGFSPSDEQEGRSLRPSKGSANMNDLRGKILRVTPLADGSVAILK